MDWPCRKVDHLGGLAVRAGVGVVSDDDATRDTRRTPPRPTRTPRPPPRRRGRESRRRHGPTTSRRTQRRSPPPTRARRTTSRPRDGLARDGRRRRVVRASASVHEGQGARPRSQADGTRCLGKPTDAPRATRPRVCLARRRPVVARRASVVFLRRQLSNSLASRHVSVDRRFDRPVSNPGSGERPSPTLPIVLRSIERPARLSRGKN